MKRNLLISGAAIWGLILVMLLPATALCRTVQVAACDWPPYMMPDEVERGPLLSIIEEALRRSGHTVVVVSSPWVRAVENVRKGTADVLVGVTYLPERERFLLFSRRVLTHHISLLALGNAEQTYQSFKELCPASIGGLRGGLVRKVFADTPCITVYEVNNIHAGLEMLRGGRMQYFFQDALALRWWMSKQERQEEQYSVLKPPAFVSCIHFGISRAIQDAEALRADIDAALQSMQEDGSLQKTLEKWGMTHE